MLSTHPLSGKDEVGLRAVISNSWEVKPTFMSVLKAITDHKAWLVHFCLSWLLVRPLPPWDIRIDFLNASESRCIVQWKDEGQVVLNRLRYRPSNSMSWNMVTVFRGMAENQEGLLPLLHRLILLCQQIREFKNFQPRNTYWNSIRKLYIPLSTF